MPPPLQLGETRVVIVNEGAGEATVELTHEDPQRLTFTGIIPPNQPMVLTLPPGTFSGAERFDAGEGVYRVRRGEIKLKEGDCYEWRVGK